MNPFKSKVKKIEQKEEKNIDDKKTILNNLLKQLIDQKLSKLEKNNNIEVKTLQALSNETQNLILSLESMSNGVRKEISIQRQKYINNANKLKNKTSKAPLKTLQNSPKILRKSISTKRLPKFHRKDSKSYDKFSLLTDASKSNNASKILGNKSKSKKKLNINNKTNDYERKTVGAIQNNFNKVGLIPHSKPRRTISPFIDPKNNDKLNKTMNKKTSDISQRKKSTQKKKSPIKDVSSKTERIVKRTSPKFANITNKENKKIEKPKLDIKTNINILEKLDSNFDDSRLQQMDVFRKSQKGLDNEKNININKEITNKNNDNKDKKDNKDNKLSFLNSLSKELEKVSTIKIDDKLVNDSLLVINNLDGGKTIPMGDLDLFRGPTFREIELVPDKEIENINNNANNNNTNSINNNDNLVRNSTKKKELNSSVLIYNKLKRTKITFLEGENDFDLIFKDSKIEDLDLNLTKINDLNTTQITDQMSLEEKLESNLDIISSYLDSRDIYNLMRANKECFKTIISFLISKTEISIELLQEEINKIKENNPNINFDNLKIKPFKLSSNSMRAISLLNSSSGNNILKLNIDQLNKKEIILIYSLYFVSIGLKKDILNLDEIGKLKYMQNYFTKNCLGQNNFGKFIEKELNGKIFDEKTISTLYDLSKKQLDIISPNYFQRINKDIAIFVFVIKDLLEQIGLIGSQFPKPDKEFLLLNSRLQANKAILDELNKIEENI